jgi:serine/threonine protein kinase
MSHSDERITRNIPRMQVTKVEIYGPIVRGPAAYKRAHSEGGALERVQVECSASYDVYGHPNIVSLLGHVVEARTGKLKGLLYEICHCDLRAVLKTKRGLMPSAQQHTILQQLLSAAHHIHQQGLVHGDIKPENVMVSIRPGSRVYDVKLGDFGMCTRVGGVSRGGTPDYMSPERLDNWFHPTRGSPADARDDVFSIALVALEMASPISMSKACKGRRRRGEGIVHCIRAGSLYHKMKQHAGLHCEPELLRVVQWCMRPLAHRPLPCEVLAYLKAHTVLTNDGTVQWHSNTPDPVHVERISMNIMVRSRRCFEIFYCLSA